MRCIHSQKGSSHVSPHQTIIVYSPLSMRRLSIKEAPSKRYGRSCFLYRSYTCLTNVFLTEGFGLSITYAASFFIPAQQFDRKEGAAKTPSSVRFGNARTATLNRAHILSDSLRIPAKERGVSIGTPSVPHLVIGVFAIPCRQKSQ